MPCHYTHKKIQIPSTSATLMVVLTTHRSEGLVRDVQGERHDVAILHLEPPRQAGIAKSTLRGRRRFRIIAAATSEPPWRGRVFSASRRGHADASRVLGANMTPGSDSRQQHRAWVA